MKGQPFSRLNVLVCAFNALLDGGMKYQEAFVRARLNTYQSRGKGKGKAFVRSHFSNKSRQGSRSKYMPHQGKREIARRDNQNHALFMKYSRMEHRYDLLQPEDNLNG